MRWLVLIVAMALIPLFTLWEKSHYKNDLAPALQQEVDAALQEERFDAVRASMEYLDVTLSGHVDDHAARLEAREVVDRLHGARAREEDNHILIYPKLSLSRTGGELQANGWLHPQNRAALMGAMEGQMLDGSALIADPHVQVLDETQIRYISKLTSDFFALPGERSLSMSLKQIILSGDVTQLQLNAWQAAGKGWFNFRNSLSGLRLYPSLYHFPDYRRQSVADADAAAELAPSLLENPIYFALASAEIAESEQPKIQRLADLLIGAESAMRFVVGGHTDATGSLASNLELGQLRAEQVIQALGELGVNEQQLLMKSFGPTQLAGDSQTEEGRRLSRRVEILIQ